MSIARTTRIPALEQVRLVAETRVHTRETNSIKIGNKNGFTLRSRNTCDFVAGRLTMLARPSAHANAGLIGHAEHRLGSAVRVPGTPPPNIVEKPGTIGLYRKLYRFYRKGIQGTNNLRGRGWVLGTWTSRSGTSAESAPCYWF